MEYSDYFLLEKMSKDEILTIIKISFLKEINKETVFKILKIKDSQRVLKNIENMGEFFKETYSDVYVFDEKFKFYLQEKAKNEICENQIKQIYIDCAHYYENKKENLLIASQYYILAKDYEKAIELITKGNINHLGIIDNTETEKYLLKIPMELVEKSPCLCINLAHIYRLNEMEIQSKYWYDKFKQIVKNIDKNSYEYQKISQMEIYYQMCLPDKNDISLNKYLKFLIAKKDKETYIKNITVTGNQPSILNGGKDLSNWARHYKTIYKIFNPLILKVFGENQKGSAEIGIAESLYLENKIEEAKKYLKIGKELSNNIDILFCAYSLEDKIEKLNSSEDKLLIEFKNRIDKEKAYHLKNNYEARIIENAVLKNDIKKCEQWNEYSKIDIINGFNLLERYSYFVKVKVLITLEKYVEALIMLERLNTYINKYNRNIYRIEYYILKSICFYLINNKEQSFDNIKKAVELAKKNNYVRLFSDEGMVIYNILEESKISKNSFIEEIKNETLKYGNLYPNKYKKLNIELTSKELEIVKLIKEGYTNNELSEILFISLATVKTHINHIYSKLGVTNRVQLINKLEK